MLHYCPPVEEQGIIECKQGKPTVLQLDAFTWNKMEHLFNADRKTFFRYIFLTLRNFTLLHFLQLFYFLKAYRKLILQYKTSHLCEESGFYFDYSLIKLNEAGPHLSPLW